MKKIFLIAAMMVATLSASAQVEKGQFTLKPTVGMNISTITGSASGKKAKVGLIAGAEAGYGIADKMALTAGLFYSMEGYKVGDAKANLDYLNIPILYNYYVVEGLALKAGIQPGFNVRHKASYDGKTANLDGIKSFNFSIPVGLSYEFSNVMIDARYNIGCTKLVKDAKEGCNSTFSFTVGYKFNL